MPATVIAEDAHFIGTQTTIDAPSPMAAFSVVFEDDGETGYLYALDPGRGENMICDALHIYNVHNVTDSDRPSLLQVAWSADGMKAVLLINQYAHGVFDFTARRGYCRTGFPPPDQGWTQHGHDWDDSVMDLFQ
jgi:hypothetical protein